MLKKKMCIEEKLIRIKAFKAVYLKKRSKKCMTLEVSKNYCRFYVSLRKEQLGK